MKKKNREILRQALDEFRDAYRAFNNDIAERQYLEENGICIEDWEPQSPDAFPEWLIKLDILQENVERVLEDEQ